MVLGQEEEKVIKELKKLDDTFDAKLVKKALTADIRSENLIKIAVKLIKDETFLLDKAQTHLGLMMIYPLGNRASMRRSMPNENKTMTLSGELHNVISNISKQAELIEENLAAIQKKL